MCFSLDRRRALLLAGSSVATLAGCMGSETPRPPDEQMPDTPSPTASPTSTEVPEVTPGEDLGEQSLAGQWPMSGRTAGRNPRLSDVDGLESIPGGTWEVGADTDGGSQAWTVSVGDESAFISAPGGSIRRVDRSDGSEQWRVDVGSPIMAPILTEDLVVTSTAGGVRALDRSSGDPHWRLPLGKPTVGVTVGNDTVVAPSYNGTLYARDAATGEGIWQRSFDQRLVTTATVIGDLVVVSQPALAAYDLATGDERWTGPEGQSGAVAHDGMVFTGAIADDGSAAVVRALDGASGTEQWTHEGPTSADVIAADADHVYVAESREGDDSSRVSYLVALSRADGSRRWERRIGDSMSGTIHDGLLAGDTLLVTRNEPVIEAVASADGSERWTYEDPDERDVGGVVATPDGTVYATLSDGGVVALR